MGNALEVLEEAKLEMETTLEAITRDRRNWVAGESIEQFPARPVLENLQEMDITDKIVAHQIRLTRCISRQQDAATRNPVARISDSDSVPNGRRSPESPCSPVSPLQQFWYPLGVDSLASCD